MKGACSVRIVAYPNRLAGQQPPLSSAWSSNRWRYKTTSAARYSVSTGVRERGQAVEGKGSTTRPPRGYSLSGVYQPVVKRLISGLTHRREITTMNSGGE
jgi:hypothetical protein